MAVKFQQLPLAITANTEDRFETFFSSEHNAVVVDGLKKLAADEGDQFIFLWGNSGSGVSHLINAVQQQTALSVQYLPLGLLSDYPAVEITEGLDQAQLLCIDDIQQVAGNAEWEQALFHLFNRLRDAGHRLLVGSQLSPRSLPLQLADLQSRLQWGSVYQLHSLTEVEKHRALQFCANNSGLELTDEVAQYLLTRCERSTRVLFDVMRRLDKASLAEQRRLTIPFVKKVLSN